jgi:tetratricopeptide (TPR) repeat protein
MKAIERGEILKDMSPFELIAALDLAQSPAHFMDIVTQYWDRFDNAFLEELHRACRDMAAKGRPHRAEYLEFVGKAISLAKSHARSRDHGLVIIDSFMRMDVAPESPHFILGALEIHEIESQASQQTASLLRRLHEQGGDPRASIGFIIDNIQSFVQGLGELSTLFHKAGPRAKNYLFMLMGIIGKAKSKLDKGETKEQILRDFRGLGEPSPAESLFKAMMNASTPDDMERLVVEPDDWGKSWGVFTARAQSSAEGGDQRTAAKALCGAAIASLKAKENYQCFIDLTRVLYRGTLVDVDALLEAFSIAWPIAAYLADHSTLEDHAPSVGVGTMIREGLVAGYEETTDEEMRAWIRLLTAAFQAISLVAICELLPQDSEYKSEDFTEALEKAAVVEQVLPEWGLAEWVQRHRPVEYREAEGRLGVSRIEAQILWEKASRYLQAGQLQEALPVFQETLEVMRKTDDLRGQAGTHGNLGMIWHQLGDLSQSIGSYLNALLIFERLGDKSSLAHTYSHLGLVYADTTDEVDRAITCYQKAMSLAKILEDSHLTASIYGNWGNVYLAKDELGEAREFYRRALEIAEDLNDLPVLVNTYASMGTVCARSHEWDKAMSWYQRGLNIIRRAPNPMAEAQTYVNIGHVCRERDRPDLNKAIEYYQKALFIMEKVSYVPGMAKVYLSLALVYEQLGRPDKVGEFKRKLEQLTSKE